MSGPKTGGYTLTPEQLKRIQEEVERQLKIMAARGRLNSRIDKVRSVVDDIDGVIAGAQRMSGITDKTMKLQKLRNEAMNVIGSISLAGETENVELMDEQAEKLKPIYENLLKARDEVAETTSQLTEEIKKKQDTVLKKAGSLSFYGVGRKNEVKVNPNLGKAVEDLKSIDVTYLPKELVDCIRQLQKQVELLDGDDFIDNFYAMSVKPLVKKCDTYNKMYRANIDEYEALKSQYEALANELGVVADNVEFSEAAITILSEKVSALKEASINRNGQKYIAQCIDEAMQEMGYSVIGSREVTKKNGRKLRHELFLFDEGTAVDVTYAGNGQISMELGGLDKEDRAPSSTESMTLVDSMVSFCDAYAELEKRLKKKGVITTRISVLPPDEEYAQIINMEDYDMTENVAEFDVEVARKQNKGQAALHKEL